MAQLATGRSPNGAAAAALQAAEAGHGELGDVICEVLKHTRLAVDVVAVGINLLLLVVASNSNIRGTHSFRVLVNATVSDLLLVCVSVGTYIAQETHLAADWHVVVATRSQWTFSITSLMCDYILVVNIYYAITLGASYKLKATRGKYEAAIVLSWIIGIFGGATLSGLSAAEVMYHPKMEMLVVSDMAVAIMTLAVPTAIVLGLFWRISRFVARKNSEQTADVSQITSARLSFCRVLRIITFVRIVVIVLVVFSNQYFGHFLGLEKDAFRFTHLSLVVYNLCKSVLYILLMTPLKRAAADLLRGLRRGEFCRKPQKKISPGKSESPISDAGSSVQSEVTRDAKIFCVKPIAISWKV